MFEETKKYIEKKKPTIKQAATIGKSLVREFLYPEQDQPKINIVKEKLIDEKSPEEATRDYFYTPYVKERTKIKTQLQEKGIDITSHPVHAAFVSLIAAARAAENAGHSSPLARNYMLEFRLPEQYFMEDTAETIDPYTKRVKLLEDTKQLGAEIVQAWMLADYYAGESNPVSDVYSIPHNSLAKTTCSFLSTCRGTDLTFEDLGISSDVSATDIISEGDNFYKIRPGYLMSSADSEVMNQIGDDFMTKVKAWG